MEHVLGVVNINVQTQEVQKRNIFYNDKNHPSHIFAIPLLSCNTGFLIWWFHVEITIAHILDKQKMFGFALNIIIQDMGRILHHNQYFFLLKSLFIYLLFKKINCSLLKLLCTLACLKELNILQLLRLNFFGSTFPCIPALKYLTLNFFLEG